MCIKKINGKGRIHYVCLCFSLAFMVKQDDTSDHYVVLMLHIQQSFLRTDGMKCPSFKVHQVHRVDGNQEMCYLQHIVPAWPDWQLF